MTLVRFEVMNNSFCQVLHTFWLAPTDQDGSRSAVFDTLLSVKNCFQRRSLWFILDSLFPEVIILLPWTSARHPVDSSTRIKWTFQSASHNSPGGDLQSESRSTALGRARMNAGSISTYAYSVSLRLLETTFRKGRDVDHNRVHNLSRLDRMPLPNNLKYQLKRTSTLAVHQSTASCTSCVRFPIVSPFPHSLALNIF